MEEDGSASLRVCRRENERNVTFLFKTCEEADSLLIIVNKTNYNEAQSCMKGAMLSSSRVIIDFIIPIF